MAARSFNSGKEKPNNHIVYKVVRPQRRLLSRYKLKKQVTLIENILNDPQIMGSE